MNARARQRELARVDQLDRLAAVLQEEYGKACEFSLVCNRFGLPISLWVANAESLVPLTVRATPGDAEQWVYQTYSLRFGTSDDVQAAARQIVALLDERAARGQPPLAAEGR
jgi:hypothetical protein